jgi:hypothetical protein
MAEQLGGGPMGHPQTAYQLGRRAKGVPLGDIGGDRDGRTPDLIGDTEVATQWLAHRDPIRRSGKDIHAMRLHASRFSP